MSIKAHLAPPSSGLFGTDAPLGVPDARLASSTFSLFPSNVGAAQVLIHSDQSTAGADWIKMRPDTKFDAEISIYDGCDYFHRDLLPVAKNPFVLEDAKLLSFAAHGGPVSIAFGGAGSSTDIEVAGSQIAFFSVKAGSKADTIDASQFLQEDSTIRVWDSGRVQTARFAIPTIGDKGPKVDWTARTLALYLNGKSYQIEVQPNDHANTTVCKEISASKLAEGGLAKISPTASHITVAMKFLPSSDATMPQIERSSMISASGLSGWLEVIDLENSNFSGEIATGRMLSFGGEVLRLTINGVERTASALTQFNGWGKFSGTRDQSGRLIFEGDALGFWEEKERLNPTRWEQLSTEVQIFLGGLIMSGLGGGIALVFKTARANKVSAWLSLRS